MKRQKTRFPGVYFRLDSHGERRYQIWYRASDGADRWETLPRGTTEIQAGQRRAQIVGDMSRGVQVAPSNQSFEDYATAWLADRDRDPDIREATYEQNLWAVKGHLIPRFGSRKLHEITVSDIARFVKDKQVAGLKAHSIKHMLSPLSQMLAIAARDGKIPTNPVKALLRKERPKADAGKIEALTTEQIEALIAKLEGSDKVLVKTLIGTGLRISEALALTWGDVDEDVIRVTGAKTEAGVREVVIQPKLRKALVAHRLTLPASGDADPVFPNETRDGVGKRVRRAGGPTLHTLRHTHASLLIAQGLDITAIAAQMGHSSPTVTLSTYAHLFDPDARRQEMRDKLELAIGGLL